MKPNIPESEDKLVYEYIFLTYLVEQLESDRLLIDKVGFKIKEVYESLIENTLRKVRRDIKELKAAMMEMNIKVFPPMLVNVEFLSYKYTAHGYEGEKRMWIAALNMKSQKRLENYLKPLQR